MWGGPVSALHLCVVLLLQCGRKPQGGLDRELCTQGQAD